MRWLDHIRACDTGEMAGWVAWITVAPVKGMALEEHRSVELESFGVLENRRFYVIGAGGRLVNGKQLGELQQVCVSWDEAAATLEFRFPDGTVAEGEVGLGDTVNTNFFGREVLGRLVVGPWSGALTAFVGRELQLVQCVEAGAGVDRGSGAVSILSTGSLEALREAAGVPEPIDARRFRMLFGVEGVAPHEEDEWIGRHIRVGEAVVALKGNVGRCIVTSRHPDTGVRNLPTLDVLAEYRDAVQTTEPLPFGVWGEVAEPGRVTLGDDVRPA